MIKYQNVFSQALKKTSSFAVFVLAAFCTIVLVFLCYFLIIVNAYADCIAGMPKGTDTVIGVQAVAFALYLYFFAATADDCFESFKEIALPLRY